MEKIDEDIFNLIDKELNRQDMQINMIASENYIPKQVLDAQGSILTNKYAEGYPGKRYYGGCKFLDQIEAIAIERTKRLFKSEHANVQPHSGTQANFAVYFSILSPKDKILSMDLTHGGHLSHGSPVNISGKLYNIFSYGVDKETEKINYESVLEIAKECKPKLIVCGASAYPREIDFKAFKDIAEEVGAYLLADIAHIAGLVATGHHNSPVPHCDFVTLTTHKTLRGARGGIILCKEENASKIDRSIFPGSQGGPLMHAVAGKAICMKLASQVEFKNYSSNIVKNSKAIARSLQGHGFRLVSGGTDNHLMLIDLTEKKITGKEAENKLENEGIVLNKNTIPFETKSPFITSGIRIGTPCVTTRGMGTGEMEKISELIYEVLMNNKKVNEDVKLLCQKYPIYKKDFLSKGS